MRTSLLKLSCVGLKLLYNIFFSIGSKIDLPDLTFTLHDDSMMQKFATGFLFGLLIFIAINLFAAHLSSDCGLAAVFGRDACADDIARAGWPLQFYEEGGFAYRSNFNSLFLLLNSAMGIIFSVICGWFLARRKKTLPK